MLYYKTTDDASPCRGRERGGTKTTMNWIYFLTIGWWLGILWFGIGLLLCLTVIGIPAGFPMILKTPEIVFGES